MSETPGTYAVWEPDTTVASIRAELAACGPNYVMRDRRDPYGYAAFLLAELDRASGVRAVQAGWERAEHEAETLRTENAHLWTAFLASLTGPQRTALRALADLSRGYGAAASGADEAGWVPAQALDQVTGYATWRAGEWPGGLFDVQIAMRQVTAYRLTEFGAAVVKALAQQEGE